MKRSILRHYVGNRDDLVDALAQRVIGKYGDRMQRFFGSLSDARPIEDMLAFFFPSKPVQTSQGLMVIESLIAAGEDNPEIRERVSQYVEQVVTMTADLLREVHPDAGRQQCWHVAYGIVSMWFNQESLAPLGLPAKYAKGARDCARRLIETLGE